MSKTNAMKYTIQLFMLVFILFASCSLLEDDTNNDPNDPNTSEFFSDVNSITVELYIDEVKWVFTDLYGGSLGSGTGAYRLNFSTADEGTHTTSESWYNATFDRTFFGDHITGSMDVWTGVNSDDIRVVNVEAEKTVTDGNIETYSMKTTDIPLVREDVSGTQTTYVFEMRGLDVCAIGLYSSDYTYTSSVQIKKPAQIDPFTCTSNDSRIVISINKGE